MPTAIAGWQQALERHVRANPAYRLRPVASLPPAQRRSLVQLGIDVSRMAGVLVAESGSALPDKLVDAAAAELFAALQRPALLPSIAAGRLAELVLDGVLEIESSAGFVCGPIAYECVIGPPQLPIAQTPPDRLSRLSHAALAYVQRLHLPDVDAIAARLYCYHRVPLSARWARAFPGPSAVLGLLREPVLTRHWVGTGAESADEYWLSWTRKARRSAAGPVQLPYKLYVSPCVEDLAEAVPAFVDALSSTTAKRFKIGGDATGLLRPDKIVVYLADVDELAAVAHQVAVALRGVRAHGVPFSAELASDGLLSWGGDPPADAGPVGGWAESWRLSVCRRLAEYVSAAQVGPLRHIRPADYALARLAMDGVDIRTFAPTNLEAPAVPDRDRTGGNDVH